LSPEPSLVPTPETDAPSVRVATRATEERPTEPTNARRPIDGTERDDDETRDDETGEDDEDEDSGGFIE
jgi:hypothetical protein